MSDSAGVQEVSSGNPEKAKISIIDCGRIVTGQLTCFVAEYADWLG